MNAIEAIQEFVSDAMQAIDSIAQDNVIIFIDGDRYADEAIKRLEIAEQNDKRKAGQ